MDWFEADSSLIKKIGLSFKIYVFILLIMKKNPNYTNTISFVMK